MARSRSNGGGDTGVSGPAAQAPPGTTQGTAPFIYNSLTDGIGTEGTTYSTSGITAYENGLAYGGKYYTAPLATHSLTANLADGNYWTTFYCGDADYQIATEGAYAYTATVSGELLTLTKQGADIPKGSAVIIVGGGNGTDPSVGISLSKTTGLSAYTGTNNLHGVDARTQKSTLGTGTFYVMSKKGDNFGFFEYTADYMPSHKAYLFVNGSGETLARGFTMVFGNEKGIETMSDVRSQMSDVWYTLDGRKLDGKPSRAGVYINKGIKVVIK